MNHTQVNQEGAFVFLEGRYTCCCLLPILAFPMICWNITKSAQRRPAGRRAMLATWLDRG